MKTFRLYSFLFALLALAFQAQAQTSDAERKERHAKIDAARIAYLTDKMNLSTEQSQNFWPLYNEYDSKRHALRRKTRVFKNEDLSKISDAQLKERINQMFDARQQELVLDKEYLDKFQKVISVRQVASMYQAEKEFMKVLLKKLNEER